MKTSIKAFVVLLLLVISSCTKPVDNEMSKSEIIQAEKAFAQMAKEKGIAVAFVAFADTNAVIKRGNDLINGKRSIKDFYFSRPQKGELQWTPDFADASGDLGYTYGQFIFSEKDSFGNEVKTKGYFHTVWKKQKDGTWKFVWD